MLNLSNVTIAALACARVYETVQALKYSMKQVKFGDSVFLSHKKPFYLPKDIRFERTSKNKTIDEFSYKLIYDLHKYVQTEFVLIIHHDGYVINPDMWRAEFLNYDYIGAPWPRNKKLTDIDGNIVRVGNGAALRSKKLLTLPSEINMPFEPAYNGLYNDDLFICVKNRHIFERYGLKFAPLDVAKYFSHEANISEISAIKPFMFHGYFGANKNNKRFGIEKLSALLPFKRKDKYNLSSRRLRQF
ncbi:MAG: hypothetical protein LBQ47_03285 [Endomicrobium sp.]|jgi:hypothetical protein|nr:hypothetical protein [Endomicrobium sp.]